MRAFPLVLAGLVLAAPAAAADKQAADLVGVLDQVVPRLMAEHHVPGAAVAVIEDGKIVAVRPYGVADQATGRKVTPQTLFNIGSVSKSFTSWGALRLVADGQLDLDAPADTYLTRWHIPPSDYDAKGVTLRRLLSHTAGLSVSGYGGVPSIGERPTLVDSLNGVPDKSTAVRLKAEPGKRWDYSGGGYTVAQLMIEEKVGQPFETWFDQTAFPAMGLKDTHFTVTPDLIERSSRPHDDQGRPVPMRVFAEKAAAGVSTTVEDLARVGVLTARHGVTADGRIFLPERLYTEMTRPQVERMPQDRFPDVSRLLGLDDVVAATHENFGIGYHIYHLPDGRTVFGHGGANVGWRAGLLVMPESGQGVAVVTNADGGAEVRDAILCYWSRHLHGPVKAGDCPPSTMTVLKKAYAKAGVAGVEAELAALKRDPSRHDVSDATLVELAYDIPGMAADPATGKDPLPDAISLLEKNLVAYPDSAVTLVGLARLYAYTGDMAKAAAAAKRALPMKDVLEDERVDLTAIAGAAS